MNEMATFCQRRPGRFVVKLTKKRHFVSVKSVFDVNVGRELLITFPKLSPSSFWAWRPWADARAIRIAKCVCFVDLAATFFMQLWYDFFKTEVFPYFYNT